jgi:hypothetical protein
MGAARQQGRERPQARSDAENGHALGAGAATFLDIDVVIIFVGALAHR